MHSQVLKWKKLIARIVDPDLISRVTEINTGGSDRRFYRLYTPRDTYILAESDNYNDFQDYVLIGSWLFRNGIPVPEILSSIPVMKASICADVGEDTLQAKVKEFMEYDNSWDLMDLYKKILIELIKLQKLPGKDFPEPLKTRTFDYDHYRWETTYFLDNCVKLFFGVEDTPGEELIKEMDQLAGNLKDDPLYPVHRDFQSQNIFVRKKRFFFLDFQSMRLGSIFYDVAALLNDPYVELPGDIQEKLLDYYLAEQRRAGVWASVSPERGRDIFYRVALQRLMQALGAYGNLGLNKGKKKFIRYIPPAVRLLQATLENVPGFPNLKELVKRLAENVDEVMEKYPEEPEPEEEPVEEENSTETTEETKADEIPDDHSEEESADEESPMAE